MRRVVYIVLPVALCFCFWLNSRAEKETVNNKRNVVNVTTAVAEKRDISQNIFAIGTVVSNREVIITSSVTKKVTGVYFEDGQFVHEKDLLVQLDDAQEQAEKKNLTATYAEQKREFERLVPLRKANIVSEKDYETQRTKMLTAAASLDLANAKLKEMQITAPFSGKVGLKNIALGTLVSAGTEITTLDDIKQVKIDFYIPEKYISTIKVGDDITAASSSYNNTVFEGKVMAISTRIDKNSRTLAVRGIFNNSNLQLHPGMSMKINLLVNKRSAICIPEKSVIYDGDKKYVYIIRNSKPIKKEVQTGLKIYGAIEITNGLDAGDSFIKSGLINIKEASAVRIQSETENKL